jgi:uncharacterized protein
MQMSAERLLPASRDTVWAALNDAEILRRSIPGCDSLEWLTDDMLAAEVRTRIGPLDTRFKGKVTLSERDAPNSYRITGEGQGAAAGFATGTALVRLLADAQGTRIQYEIDATVGGKLAQIGSRLIDAAARKLADDFFERFAAEVAPAPPEASVVPAAARPAIAGEPVRRGLRPIVWVPLLIGAIALLLLFVALN